MKNKVWIFSGFGISFLLGILAYAFLPGLFTSDTAGAQSENSGPEIEIAVEEIIVDENGNETMISGLVDVSLENPPNLPQVAADVRGIYTGHAGDLITVGTGNLSIEVEIEQINNQEPVMAVAASFSGPELGIEVDPGATIYLETTEEPQPTAEDVEAGEMTVLRSFEQGSLDDLAENTMIEAWGSEENGVLVVDTLIISPIR